MRATQRFCVSSLVLVTLIPIADGFGSLAWSPRSTFLSNRSRCSSSSLHLVSSDENSFNVKLNEFFKRILAGEIQAAVGLDRRDPSRTQFSLLDLVTARPSLPGTPRPLWLVIIASVPTGLIWYGYYKFAVEEELLVLELSQGKTPRGFGGYGTLGPFTYGLILGPVAAFIHFSPGGIQLSVLAIVFIYYTQFLLYDRVNELYRDEGLPEPLTVWWCWPIFFPLNLIVGLRQVHFLSQYWYRRRGALPPPADPVTEFFPFLKKPTLTWQELFTTPSLWCILLSKQSAIDRNTLPQPMQDLLAIGDDKADKRDLFK